MKKSKHRILGFIVLCISALFVLLYINTTKAETVTITIAYYNIENTINFDEAGKASGYLADILSKICDEEISFKYVGGTKEECQEYLKKGLVDFIYGFSDIDADYTINRLEPKLYKSAKVEKYLYNETQELHDITIGVVDDDDMNEYLYKFIETNGITKYTVKEYENSQNLLHALKNRDIALMYSCNSYEDNEIRLIYTMDSVPLGLYTDAAHNDIRLYLEKLIEKDILVDYSIFEDLEHKYYGDSNNTCIEFTSEEKEYLNNKNYTLSVLFSDNLKPLAYYDVVDKKPTGVSHDILETISDLTGIVFKYNKLIMISEGISAIKSNEADLLAGIPYNGEFKYNNVIISQPYLTQSILLIGSDRNIEYPKTLENTDVGMINYCEEINNYILKMYPNANIHTYEYPEECLQAIIDKEIDYVIMNNMMFNDYSAIEEYKTLKVIDSLSNKQKICFVVDEEQPVLLRIINKAINYIDDRDIDLITNTYITKKEQITINQVIEQYSYVVFRFIAVVIVVFILIFLIENIRKRALLNIVAYTDSITGLINYNRFKILAANTIKNTSHKYALIQFDIDKFKIINDLYGTVGGDNTLKYIANKIKSSLKKDEMITRVYADNFCILIRYEKENDIIKFIDSTYDIIAGATKSVRLVSSYGVYLIGDENITVDLMNDRALIAKKAVKGYGVKHYSFYDKEARERVLAEKEIEDKMENALEAGEFEVYLQPQYLARGERIVAAEALVRWNDPIKGLIMPSEFINLFEKNNFIVKLDFYIWEQVCILIKKWMDEGKTPVPIAVNVSRAHLITEEFIYEFLTLIELYQIPKDYIELEVTETAIVNDMENAVNILKMLHDKGFVIAMDDFGSGYSSLNLLNKLPISVLKIDRGFLNEITTSKKGKIVIEEIITMAKRLDITVVCEGVETEEQAMFIRKTQCDRIQGFYYSKPIQIANFESKIYDI